MVNLYIIVTVRSGLPDNSRSRQNLEKFASYFRAQCCPDMLTEDFWSQQPFLYYPDEKAEVAGIQFAGLSLSLRRPCKSPHRAVLVAQIIAAFAQICNGLFPPLEVDYEVVSLS